MSMTSRLEGALASTPSGPRIVASTSGGPGSMVITVSAARLSSATEAAGLAPSASNARMEPA